MADTDIDALLAKIKALQAKLKEITAEPSPPAPVQRSSVPAQLHIEPERIERPAPASKLEAGRTERVPIAAPVQPPPTSPVVPMQAIRQTIDLLDGLDPKNRKQVRQLQERLVELKVDPGGIDGGYGPNTRRGIEAFQHTYAAQIDDIRTEQQARKKRESEERTQRISEALPSLHRLDKQGRLKLEQDLQAAGLNPGKVDGEINRFSYRALRHFSAQHTPSAIKETVLDVLKTASQAVSTLNADEILEFQHQLNFIGIDAGPATGRWNKETEQAKAAALAIHDTSPITAALDKKQITEIQRNLRSLGHYSGMDDGKSSARLLESVQKFVASKPELTLPNPQRLEQVDSRHIAAMEFIAKKEGMLEQSRFFLFPIQGEHIRVSSPVGMRNHPNKNIGRRMHNGTDFSPRDGNPLLDGEWYNIFDRKMKHAAVHDAVVTSIRRDIGMLEMHPIVNGRVLRNERIVYHHMDEINVKDGQVLAMGQTVGRVGERGESAGVHAHIEHWVDGKPQNFRFAYLVDGKVQVLDANQHVNRRFDYSQSVQAAEQLLGRPIAKETRDANPIRDAVEFLQQQLKEVGTWFDPSPPSAQPQRKSGRGR